MKKLSQTLSQMFPPILETILERGVCYFCRQINYLYHETTIKLKVAVVLFELEN